MEITRSSQSNRKSSPANFSPGEKSAGVVAAPVIDQWSTRTPEKPIPNRMPRTVLSLKDVREAARKLRKLDPVRREVSDPFLSSDELKSPLVSESPAPASERKKDVNSVKLPEKWVVPVLFWFPGLYTFCASLTRSLLEYASKCLSQQQHTWWNPTSGVYLKTHKQFKMLVTIFNFFLLFDMFYFRVKFSVNEFYSSKK